MSSGDDDGEPPQPSGSAASAGASPTEEPDIDPIASPETLLRVSQMKARIENTMSRRLHLMNARRRRQIAMEANIKGRNLSKEDASRARRAYNSHESSRLRMSRLCPSPSSFECVEIIGKGAFGEVRIVRVASESKDDRDDEEDGEESRAERVFAMKSMRKRDMIAKNQASHVLAERNLMVLSSSAWLVTLFYSFQDIEYLYLVMEFCGGGDLMTILMREDILTEESCRFYMSELACAINAVHELSFVHRDLKPDNILISNSGHIKLSDFGLAKSFDSRMDALVRDYAFDWDRIEVKEDDVESLGHHRRDRDRMFSTVGTPDYIAPEVFSSKGYDVSVDWWSLGVIMFECLVGYPPFYAEDPLQTCKKIVHWRKYFRIPKDAHLSDGAADLIHSLVCSHRRRIGFDDIILSSFWCDLPWINDGLLTISPPFEPDLSSGTDASNFDTIEAEQDMNARQSVRSARSRKYDEENLKANAHRSQATDNERFWNYEFKRPSKAEQVVEPDEFFRRRLGPMPE